MTKAYTGKSYEEMVGETYGYLVVKKVLPRERNPKGVLKSATVECYCKVCGSTTLQKATLLIKGRKSSCGCLSRNKDGWGEYAKKAKRIERITGKDLTPKKTEPKKPKRKKPAGPLERETSWIVDVLHAKYICGTPAEDCLRNKLAHLCCCECDKRNHCGKACKNTPDKCGASVRQNEDGKECTAKSI